MNQRINKRIIPDITRDIAEWRSQFHQCPLVLGSATPSLESYARTEKGVYQLLTLPTRVNQQALPSIDIVDMREELSAGNRSMFSNELREAIEDRLRKMSKSYYFLIVEICIIYVMSRLWLCTTMSTL